MRGHVLKRGSRWGFVHDLEPDASGKRRQRWRGGFSTKREAERALAASMTESTRSPTTSGAVTLETYFFDEWLPSLHDLRPNTVLSYETLGRRHLIPILGRKQLRRLTRSDCEKLISRLAAGEARPPLSPATIRRVHALLHACLNAALRDGLVHANAAAGVRLPRDRHRTGTTWSPQQLQRFLDATLSDPLGPLFLVLATTGMRRGEAVGLCWSQVDLANCAVSVRQSMLSVRYKVIVDEPKTTRSSRTIAVDPITVAVLRHVQQRQDAQRQLRGSAWHPGDYVFTREDGSPWHPEYVSKRFAVLVKRAGLPRIRLHDLRHTHASLALRGGVHLKVMQERLGHSSISVTANMYSHVAPGLQHDAATRIADLALGSWVPPLANR